MSFERFRCPRCGEAANGQLGGLGAGHFTCTNGHVWKWTPHPAMINGAGSLASSVPDRPPEPESPRREPDRLTGRIIGFRGWTLDGYKLRSANTAQHGGFWKLGPNRAECRIEARRAYLAGVPLTGPVVSPHAAPHPACECGWNAYFDVRRENNPHNFKPGELVWGAVAAWGRIEVHASGFRAEWAEPVVLAYHPRDPYEQVVRLRAMAGEMGLPCVTLDELPGEALKHGREVPLELRPPEEPAPMEEPAWWTTWEVPLGQEPTSGAIILPAGAVTPSFASGGVVERRGLANLREASERIRLAEEARQRLGGSAATLPAVDEMLRESGRQAAKRESEMKRMLIEPPGPFSQWLSQWLARYATTPEVAPEPKGRKIRGVKAHLKTLGPPTLGKHREGDVISDRRGDQYVCVRSGKPGSWQAL